MDAKATSATAAAPPPEASAPPPPARRPYTRPRLRVYGDLHVITGTNVTMNMLDMGSGAASRT